MRDYLSWGKYRVLILSFFIFHFSFFNCNYGKAQVFDVIVDASGNGDYTSVQDAVNSIPNYLPNRTLIFIKKGIYREKVVVSSSKTNLSLIGENAENVVISWDDNPTKDGISGADSYTFWADSPGLYAENITFENTSGNVGQAVALRTTGDTMVFKNCRMLGFQDTYYSHKRRQYNYKCYIEGATDFIYGDATAVFDSCTINCVKGGQYITAPADAKTITHLVSGDFLHGLQFRNCTITADPDVPENSYYLGRPWQPAASSVYINCILGNHIKPQGWSTWGATDNHLTSYFAEYHSKNPDGTAADTTQRVSWSYQISDTWYNNLYKYSFFFRKSGITWDPVPYVTELPAPENLEFNSGVMIWDPVDGAVGYVIYANDSVIGFSVQTQFETSGTINESDILLVKSVNKNGNLSMNTSNPTTGITTIKQKDNLPEIFWSGKTITFSEVVDFKIYNLKGQIIFEGNGTKKQLPESYSGIFMIKAKNRNGAVAVKKITL